MILDTDEQRKLLLQILEGVTFKGTEAAKTLVELKRALELAGVKGQLEQKKANEY